MTRQLGLMAIAAAVALMWTGSIAAHEGHEHTVMGTVQKVGAKFVEVKTQDQKTKVDSVVSIVLTGKTEVLRGAHAVQLADIKVGERIVVMVVMGKDAKGTETMTARQVRLAEATATRDLRHQTPVS